MKTLIILLLAVFGAVSASAQKVKVGADPNVDLSKYKTYAWDKGIPASNPLISELIRDAIDEAMTAKGLTKADVDADVTLVAWAALGADLQVSYPNWWNPMNSVSASANTVSTRRWEITKGTLVIDIADARTKNTVWRGSASSTLPYGPSGDLAKDAKNTAKPIRKAVEKMFKQYPRPSGN